MSQSSGENAERPCKELCATGCEGRAWGEVGRCSAGGTGLGSRERKPTRAGERVCKDPKGDNHRSSSRMLTGGRAEALPRAGAGGYTWNGELGTRRRHRLEWQAAQHVLLTGEVREESSEASPNTAV